MPKITVLQTRAGLTAHKKYHLDSHGEIKSSKRQHAKYVKGVSVSVDTPEALHAALTKLERAPRCFIVLGDLGEKCANGYYRRSLKTKPGDAGAVDPPGIRVNQCQVLVLDIDNGAYPDGCGPDTPHDELARAVHRELPPELARVSCVAQFSGSHGVKGCRLKLLFLLAEPREYAVVRQYVEAWGLGDPSVVSPVQPVYTALPELGSGIPDPFNGSGRCFLLPGDADRALIPETVDLEAHRLLAKCVGWVLAAPSDNRHGALNKAAWTVGGLIGAGRLEEGYVTDRLRAAILDSPAIDADRVDSALEEIQREIADGMAQPIEAPALMFDYTEGGKLMNTFRNHVGLMMSCQLATNDFDTVELLEPPPWAHTDTDTPRQWTDADDRAACLWMGGRGLHTTPRVVRDAALTVADSTRIDCLRAYLDRCKALPPGDLHLSDMWIALLGVEDTPYTRAAAVRFMVMAAKRALHPGCKAELMPALIGAQGVGKSRFARWLFTGAGDRYFIDTPINLSNPRQFGPQIRGVWAIEFSENHSLSQWHLDVQKRFISSTEDTFVPPYGRSPVTFKRRCAYVLTTNYDTPLTDPDGARRQLPLIVDRLRADMATDMVRDQLWGQAVRELERGEQTWLTDAETEGANAARHAASETDPLYFAVRQLAVNEEFDGRKHPDVLDRLLAALASRPSLDLKVNTKGARRLRDALKKLGWFSHVVRLNSGVARNWIAPDNWVFNAEDTNPFTTNTPDASDFLRA